MKRFETLADLRDYLNERIEYNNIDYDIVKSGPDTINWYYNLFIRDQFGKKSPIEENIYYLTREEIEQSHRNYIGLNQWLRMSPALDVPVRITVRSGDDYWSIGGIYENISDVDHTAAGDLIITGISTCWIRGNMCIDLQCRN